MEKILYLHCGTHKTGTTSIQHYLNNNKELLEKNNLIYTNIGNTKQYPYNNHGIAWHLSGDPRLKFEKDNNSLKEFYNFLKVSEKNIIISSEDFQFFNIEKNSYSGFCEEISKYNFKIKPIIYLRNQIDFFRGIYQIFLMLGVRFINYHQAFKIIQDNNSKLELKNNKLTIFFNYLDLIENIKEKLDIKDEDIICKSYDQNKQNLIKSLNNILGINETLEINIPRNVALPELVIELLETLNRNFHKSKIDLNSVTVAHRNILGNKAFRLGQKFKIEDENIKKFFKDQFYQSNSKIEKIYNIEINKFLN